MLEKIKEAFMFFHWLEFIKALILALSLCVLGVGLLLIAVYGTWWPLLLLLVAAIGISVAFAMY